MARTESENVSPTVSVTFYGCVDDRRRRALRNGEHGHAAVGRPQRVGRANPEARRRGDRIGEEDRAEVEVLVRRQKLREELLVGHAAEERGDERRLFDGRRGAMQEAREVLLHAAGDRFAGVENGEADVQRASCCRGASGTRRFPRALGERPRTSLNMRLIQPAFVEPASAKYSGDAMICASICSSVIPAANAGIQKLTSAAEIGRCRNVE